LPCHSNSCFTEIEFIRTGKLLYIMLIQVAKSNRERTGQTNLTKGKWALKFQNSDIGDYKYSTYVISYRCKWKVNLLMHFLDEGRQRVYQVHKCYTL
jgi:hypothetical protein